MVEVVVVVVGVVGFPMPEFKTTAEKRTESKDLGESEGGLLVYGGALGSAGAGSAWLCGQD